MSRLLYGNSDFFSLNPSGVPVVGQTLVTGTVIGMSGTGAPESKVAAPPGSTWLQTDSTTDVKGWIRWVKATGTGSTGWVAGPEADTGWRDVSAGLLNSWTGQLMMRRVGAEVHLRLYALSGASATNDVFYAAPAGFRFDSIAVFPWGNAGAKNLVVRNTGNVDSSARDAVLYAYVSYLSTDTWPSSLPGVAA